MNETEYNRRIVDIEEMSCNVTPQGQLKCINENLILMNKLLHSINEKLKK